MGRTARTAQAGSGQARAAVVTKARTRRAALDSDHTAREARIDAAVVDHYLALDRQAEGQQLIAQADADADAGGAADTDTCASVAVGLEQIRVCRRTTQRQTLKVTPVGRSPSIHSRPSAGSSAPGGTSTGFGVPDVGLRDAGPMN